MVSTKLQIPSRLPSAAAIRRLLLGGSAFLSAGLLAGNVVAQVYQMVVARFLSPEDYGALVTLTAISYVVATLMRTFQAWVIVAVAGSGPGARGDPRAVFAVAMRTLVPVGIVLFGVHWIGAQWVADFLQLNSAALVILLGLYAFSAILIPVACGLLMGLGRLHAAGIAILAEPVFRLVVGVALVVLGLGASGALLGYAAGNVLAFAVGLVPLWPVLARRRNRPPGVGGFGSLDRFTMLGLVANTCLMVVSSIDQVAVKHFLSAETAGNYAVAFLLGRIIGMSALALSWVIFTRSANMAPDDPGRPVLLIRWLALVGGLGVASTAAYLLAPGLVVLVMGGSQYTSAYHYVGLVGVEMTLFALVSVQVYYQMSVKRMAFVPPMVVAALAEGALVSRYHGSVEQILLTLIVVMAGLLACVSVLSWRAVRPIWTRETASTAPAESPAGIR